MSAIAILPVKRFGAAKRRLAAGIDDARREALVAAMLGDVLEAIGAARTVERTIVVSSEPRAAEAAEAAGAEAIPDPGGEAIPDPGGEAIRDPGGDGHPKPVAKDRIDEGGTGGTGSDDSAAMPAGVSPTQGTAGGGHSEAALAGIARATEGGADCVVLLPGDCPLLESRELDRLLTGVPERYVAIVPDRHGTGTNALVLSPPDAIRPAFGEGSRARHVAAAREAGIPSAVEQLPSLALDLDTPADLVALTREIEANPGRAARTARALGL